MPGYDQIFESFLGGDPLLGAKALKDLLAAGDAGEDEFFSRPVEFSKSAQVRRRCLRYVASRPKSVAARLVEKMKNAGHSYDSAAFLFAGLEEDRDLIEALYSQISGDFPQGRPSSAMFRDYSPASSRFWAWGYAGGSTATLWHYVRNSSFAWEKLKTAAFRASCVATARTRAGDCWTIEQLITHKLGEDGEMEKIGNSPDTVISHNAIEGSELGGAANTEFLLWRRGEVADEILGRWSGHEHWRVRDFGAQVLAGLGFRRTTTPMVEWLGGETVPRVRASLLRSLERNETAEGADAMLEHFHRHDQEGLPYLAKAAWRASDPGAAIAALKAMIAGDDDSVGAEAMVSLARLGQSHARLMPALDSGDPYRRLNAALAVAYLGDKSVLGRLTAMRNEAASPFERIFLAAALAVLGMPEGAQTLHRELAQAAGARGFDKHVDPFFMHRYLQTAVLDGLAAGGAQTSHLLEAWRAEMEPLEPVPKPLAEADVLPAVEAAASPALVQGPQTAEKAEALRVFISYSHEDEKMRMKLGRHLMPLVDAGLIRIWHDREIEAGGDWKEDIDQEIGGADIILLLVSASFLNSRYCRAELLRALEQRSAGKARPIPIILRACDWMSVFNRADHNIQALPRDNRPVSGGKWVNQDAAFAVIAQELRTIIERMRGRG